jgi:hypothetical protein
MARSATAHRGTVRYLKGKQHRLKMAHSEPQRVIPEQSVTGDTDINAIKGFKARQS